MQRILILVCLIIAGETIFSLPFHITRFFRPTFLEVFALSNADLGDIFAFYGIAAMLAYFPGGAIADRFSARNLMTFSLLATAVGGFWLAQIPGRMELSILFAYWGVSTILLFWAALIKTTKEWGGVTAQGQAFGVLDGGRGLIAAGTATLAVIVFKYLLPIEFASASAEQRKESLQLVIYFYTFMTLLAALLVLLIIPHHIKRDSSSLKNYFSSWPILLKSRLVWLQAIIVICAYCGFKGLDNYGLYAVDVLGMNDMQSAEFMATSAYLRPVAAILAGYLVDRYFASKIITLGFGGAVISYLVLVMIASSDTLILLLYANVIFTFACIYGLRGVYFALLEETKTMHQVTGVTIGLISLVGFTPDIFFAPLAGRILDSAFVITNFQLYFAFLALFAIIGAIASLRIMSSRVRIN